MSEAAETARSSDSARLEDSDIPYSERELIQRVIRERGCNFGVTPGRYPRWRYVGAMFDTDEDAARRICWHYGFEPDEEV